MTIQDFQERLNTIYPKEFLQAISWNGFEKKCEVKCIKCNTIYQKIGRCFLDKRKVSICKNCFPTQFNQLKTDWIPPQDYILLSQYRGMQNKVTLKHNICGFIWQITPTNLKLGKRCPKCNKKISKGEQKIIFFLKLNNIDFIHQYPIEIEGHHLIIDFYLPKQELFIEYNGEQHYNAVNYFGGEEKFLKQQELDNLKQKILKNKLIVIPYTDFDKIDKILESSTTIL